MIVCGLCLVLISSFALPPPKKNIQSSIHAGREFLIKSVLNDKYFLTCQSSTLHPCPLVNTGKIFASFFIVNALNQTSLPDNVRDKIKNTLYSEQRNNLWGYSINAPLDSDDSSFALQTLYVLNCLSSSAGCNRGKPDSVNLKKYEDRLQAFLQPNSKNYFTFLINQQANISTIPSEKQNLGIHLEVNTNIYYLLYLLNQNEKINYNFVVSMQNPNGSWPSFFYPSSYYSTYFSMKLLCLTQSSPQTIEKGLQFIISTQKKDGSWGDVYNTALALNTLFSCQCKNKITIENGVQYLLKMQTRDGYWENKLAVWSYVFRDQPQEIWQAYDSEHVITTSLVLQALTFASR